MRPIRDTISLDEARALIDGAIASRSTRTERVPLVHANGRVLAADVVADRDVPPFARAAMDGYAVVAEDTFGASRHDPKTLRVRRARSTRARYRRQACRRRRGRRDRHRRADA